MYGNKEKFRSWLNQSKPLCTFALCTLHKWIALSFKQTHVDTGCVYQASYFEIIGSLVEIGISKGYCSLMISKSVVAFWHPSFPFSKFPSWEPPLLNL